MTDVTPPAPGDEDAYLAELGLGPVELGSMLFTIVEPHAGWERAYNRWYERDHYYAGCLVGAHNFAGKRWVATRELKERRYTDGSLIPDASVGSFLSMYWVEKGHHQDWNKWAFRQFRWLHENERMFPHREHVHTLLYTHDWAHYRDADPIPASIALDHPFKGLAVIIGEAAEGDRDELDRWFREEHLPEALPGSSSAMALSFSPIALEVEAKDVAKDDGGQGRFLHLHFLDEDPIESGAANMVDHAAAFDKAGVGKMLFGATFIPTVPGTDTYLDQL